MSKSVSKLSSSTGWYQPDGSPVNLVESSEGTVRECTLREARNMGLLPSVGRILRVLNDEPRNMSRIRNAATFAAKFPTLPLGAVLALADEATPHTKLFGGAWHRMAHDLVGAFVPGLNAGRLPALAWCKRIVPDVSS